MPEPPVDPEAFRTFEHVGWQSAVDQYHDSFGKLTSQTIGPLLDAVETGRSTGLLDVASGPGYVAHAAAQRGAAAMGVDFSAAMVAKARVLFPGLDIREGDAEVLPFPAETFDVVVMNFGLLHLSRPETAISEAYRVLRGRGRFGFTVWAKPERAVGFQIVLRAIQEKGDPDIPLPQGPPFFRFSDEAECRRVLLDAGFVEPTISSIDLTWELSSPEELYTAFYSGTARTGGLMRAQSAGAAGAIKAAIERSAQAYRGPQGILRLPMPAVAVTSIKP